ncbi:MAG: PIG-L deacetylase family protein [Candidatus Pacearchaeota archaeon]
MDRVLAIGPHPDDLEIGCFGTLIKLKEIFQNEVHLLILTDGAKNGLSEVRREEAEKSAQHAGFNIQFANFPDGSLMDNIDVVSYIEDQIKKINPQVIFIPSSQDTHQDHRNAHLASLGAGRNGANFLSYETPSTINFKPSLFVEISNQIDKKLHCLKFHQSQTPDYDGLANVLRMDALVRGGRLRVKNKSFESFEVIRFIF